MNLSRSGTGVGFAEMLRRGPRKEHTTMARRSFFLPRIGILVSIFFPLATFAQVQHTGSIIGRVLDANGGVLPGVAVELMSPALLRSQSTATDDKGSYRLIQLPIGEYRLTFSLPSFQTVSREQIPVSADKTLTINVTLALAGVEESVTVVGQAPVVDVKSATNAVHLDRQTIDDIPTSRDVWSFLQNRAPQVVNSREDVGGSESGLQRRAFRPTAAPCGKILSCSTG
jgi:hypothetical protein